MKLLFKQRFISWFDSYDIYNEDGSIAYVIKGQFGWGHCLKVMDAAGRELGMVKQKVFSMYPTFWIIQNGERRGKFSRVFSFPHPKYRVDYRGWEIVGNFIGMEYQIKNQNGEAVAEVSKQFLKLTDTYVIDVPNSEDALDALMAVVSIDAEKCMRNKS